MPENELPTGISTRRRKPFSLREQQALLHAGRADRAERAKQWHAQAANKSLSGGGCTTINAFPVYAAISPFVGWWIVVSPPKHCSLQLQSRSGPNNDGSAVTVAAIFYGEKLSLDVRC